MPRTMTLNELNALAKQIGGIVQARSDGESTTYWLLVGGDEVVFSKKSDIAHFINGYALAEKHSPVANDKVQTFSA